MTRLVDRLGRTGFAAASSVIWALPMAAWAGSADLSPIDKTAYPWVALAIGSVMLVVWIGLLTRLGRFNVTVRQRRFDLAQMSAGEKRWTLVTIAFATGLIAWLNAAATVDSRPLMTGVGAGNPGALLLALALMAFLAGVLIGIAVSWRRASAAYDERRARASLSI
ncbi:MAG TPA: hypothetical protein VFK22_03290 [Candidatus Dormibacteraeota bacterium]|nr:hypothetical protein [Candidatus Dormibacteraeota bacterium]